MLETIVADNGSRFLIAAAAVVAGLVCLVAVLWIIRSRPSSPFIRGGKNRQPRLAVLDAAAVDTRRRLVLIRRDDVEHLIMIGGPTDIVIESRIATGDEVPAPAEQKVAEPAVAPSRPVAIEPETQAAPMVQTEVAAVQPVQPVARPLIRPEEQPATRLEPAAPMRVVAEQRPVVAPTAATEARPVARATPAVEVPSVAVVETPQANFDMPVTRPMPVAQPAQQPVQAQAVQAQRPAPAMQQQVPATSPLSDFERLLDAEISGDLQRLGPAGPVTPSLAPESRTVTPVGRQEPLLGTPAAEGSRREPTIEEEMNRMLADISAGRKP
ncbi:histidine kinase [Ensifer sp. MJa1]|uniref:histidine kinase n=1 Tax=Ensifer sp. MJa1 TaxID=2919888 RepID=UPI003009D573